MVFALLNKTPLSDVYDAFPLSTFIPVNLMQPFKA